MDELGVYQEMFQETCRNINAYNSIAGQWLHPLLAKWRKLMENEAPPPETSPFHGASKATTALTCTILATHAGQLGDPVLSSVPMVLMKPTDPKEVDATAKLERFAHNRLTRPIFKKLLPEAIRGSDVDGISYFLVNWNKRTQEEDISVMDAANVGYYPPTASDLDQCSIVWYREDVYPVEMTRRVIEGRYDQAAAEKLTEGVPYYDSGDVLSVHQRINGKMGDFTGQNYAPVTVYHVYMRGSVDGRTMGMWECDIEPQTQTLLSPITPYAYQHGRLPIIPLVVNPRYPEKKYLRGQSIAELLKPQQEQANGVRRQRADNTTLSMASMVLVRKGALTVFDEIGPLVVKAVSDVERDIKALPIRPSGTEVQPVDEQYIKAEAREIVGVTPEQAGIAADTPLGVVKAANTGSNTRTARSNIKIAEAVIELTTQMIALYAQYSPASVVMGHPADIMLPEGEHLQLSSEILGTRAQMSLAVASAETNPVVKQQLAEKNLLADRSCPMVQADPALQYEAEKRYRIRLNEPDIERSIGTLDNWMQRRQAAGEKEEPPKINWRADETASLAKLLETGEITPEAYQKASVLMSMNQKDPGSPPPQPAAPPLGPGMLEPYTPPEPPNYQMQSTPESALAEASEMESRFAQQPV